MTAGGRTLVAPRLLPYLAGGVAGLVAALLLGRPEPAVAAAPLLLFAVLGLAFASRPRLDIDVRLDRDRAFEGEVVGGTLRIQADAPLDLRLAVRGARGRRVEGGPRRLRAGPGAEAEVPFGVRCLRWGGSGRLLVEADASGAFGLLRHHWSLEFDRPLRVYPAGERLRRLTRAHRTGALAGDRVSRVSGDGIEFAGVRLFEPGDSAARVNWRATARRGSLHVNQMHPERNAEVVIFIDTFADLRGAGASTFEISVRGAAALAELHLRGRDRVGLVGFGGTLRWLRPGQGSRQLHRVLDSLIDTDVAMSYAWKGIEVIPRRTIPPRSLVLGLSPLLDDRSVGALADLRLRGHDVAVVEVAPEGLLAPPRGETQLMARRLWAAERGAVKERLRGLGVAVGRWEPGERIDAALAEIAEYRRRAGSASA